MVIPNGAMPKKQDLSVELSLDSDKKKKKSKKKKNHFDDLLEDLETYEAGCETRTLMDST